MIICKVTLGDTNIDDLLKKMLTESRSVSNLQCAGCYYAWKGDRKEALLLLKEAFILNQMNYHANRLLFLLLVKETPEQAIDFLVRIR